MNSQKKLKLIISSLKDKDLIKLFESYIGCFPNSNFTKNIRQISFNCFQSVCEFRGKVVNGYGKNSTEAFVNGVRNLIDIVVDDEKNQTLMRECLRKFNLITNDSKKKLLSTEKTFKTVGDVRIQKAPLAMSTNFNYGKKPQKDKSIKEEIFQYFNLEKLKICKPNTSNKPKNHERYMNITVNQTKDQQQLRITLQKIATLQSQISQATQQNEKLKEQLAKIYQNKENIPSEEKSNLAKSSSKSNIYSNYVSQYNHSDQNKNKNKNRSISVDPTQKYFAPFPNTPQVSSQVSKKIKVPKLNLQVLPNYHGKSNKSLNQSLLQVYQKAKK